MDRRLGSSNSNNSNNNDNNNSININNTKNERENLFFFLFYYSGTVVIVPGDSFSLASLQGRVSNNYDLHVLNGPPLGSSGGASVPRATDLGSIPAFLGLFHVESYQRLKGATPGTRKQTSAGQGLTNISVITETGESWEDRCAGVSRSEKKPKTV